MIRFGLIKERKTPPDRRVVFSPQRLAAARERFPDAEFVVESSEIRIFPDQAYREQGFEVTEDMSSCDVLLGVKEVPIPHLIAGKKYFFFSHTIKKQPYNRDLLREILKKKIELYDHEVIVDEKGGRLIGFGRYAGLVGAYNGFRGIGLKNGIFELPKAEDLPDLNAMLSALDDISVPAMKIVVSGSGKVAKGAREILDHLKIKKVKKEDFLNKTFDHAVYCQIDVLNYNKRKDGGKGSRKDFYRHPEKYDSDFSRFAHAADFFIAGHFYGEGAPVFFTSEEAKDPRFNLKYIADISCDINGPIASTIRPSTIAEPFYGYDPGEEREVDFRERNALLVMAVDNLPCELPKDASEGFGEMFMEHVLPAFFNGDKDSILERARMTKDGKLTRRYEYLKDYVKGQEVEI